MSITETIDAPSLNSTSEMSGLSLKGITVSLGGRTIVDQLDLAVNPGELVALLGPSGCGKTTTLRTVAGFLHPQTGEIRVNGEDVTQLGPEHRPTTMVFQNYALWPHMTVQQNVAFPLKIARVPKSERDQRVREALELVGLQHHTNSKPSKISGGEQQRAALARALVQRPKVLLLDEPLSNLDAQLRVRVREEIREIQQRLEITTILVTHDQEEAMSICDRIAVMNGGRIEQYDHPTQLYSQPLTTFVAHFIGSSNSIPTLDLTTGTDDDCWIVRPEHVLVGDGGIPADIVRQSPHGAFTELTIHSRGHILKSTVPSDRTIAEGPTCIRFSSALHYHRDRLVERL